MTKIQRLMQTIVVLNHAYYMLPDMGSKNLIRVQRERNLIKKLVKALKTSLYAYVHTFEKYDNVAPDVIDKIAPNYEEFFELTAKVDATNIIKINKLLKENL